MKAVVAPTYGSPDVLRIVDVEKPSPKDDEILVKVAAASINAGDWRIVRASPSLIRFMYGLTRPNIKALGSDVAGRVEAVGARVTEFRVGDAVIAELSAHGCGACAEYVCAPASVFAAKPAQMTMEESACLPVAGLTALQGVRDHGGVRSGDNVLVVGASGCVGIFAVQIAKSMGATVTGVCRTEKMEMVRSIGADHVVDYTREDVTHNGDTYDVILDAGAFRSIFDYAGSLKSTGRYVLVGGSMNAMWQGMFFGPLRSRKGGKRYITFVAKPNSADLTELTAMADRGELRSVIGGRYTLESVADALRAVESGSIVGKAVVVVAA
jgi:NADPH:quinone reductase-like Zn-dependent oxidoreductase